jgi:nucleotide-binding universal stress UspA family protein
MRPKIDKILYCTQLGPNSAYVFRYAYAIASRFDAEIVVLHVMDTLTPKQKALVEGYSGQGSLSEIISQAEREAAARIPKRIEEWCHREFGHEDWRKIVTSIVVAEGHTPDQILAHVESTGADLLVIGAHAESAMMDRLIGNTARTLIKHSSIPVLTVQVPEGRQELTMTDI